MTDEEVSERLLALARGRLSDEEAVVVEREASANPKLAEELAYYRGLASAVAPTQEGLAPNALGWARLSKAIDGEAGKKNAVFRAANSNAQFWRAAAAVLAVVVTFQAAFLLAPAAEREAPIYVSVSEDAAAFDVQAAFVPTATEEDLRTLLRSINGEIVNGPSAIGVYTVRFTSAAHRESGLERMLTSPTIVESASTL